MKVILIIITLIIVLYILPLGTYFDSKVNGLKISFIQLLRLRAQKVPSRIILDWTKELIANRYNVTFSQLVDLYKKDYDLYNITNGLIKARDKKVYLTLDKACEADLNNIDICKTIQRAISDVEIKE
jgi:uncharacterized protein YqfA (UPF0365 family)